MSIKSLTPILQIENLSKTYNNTTDKNKILDNINLEVYPNEFVCVLGPSGCGKTTLIRCIAGFEDYEGNINVENEVVNIPNSDRFMVFQDFNQLFPWSTVENNVKHPLKLNGIRNSKKREELAHFYLDMVGLLEYKNYYPHQLSGGMKQRVAIAKALALNPKIILMDEPFASLDAISRRNLQEEILGIRKTNNMTVIFITHNIQEAIVLGTRILVLSKDGKVKMDVPNTLLKPITPASEGYGDLWKQFNQALNE